MRTALLAVLALMVCAGVTQAQGTPRADPRLQLPAPQPVAFGQVVSGSGTIGIADRERHVGLRGAVIGGLLGFAAGALHVRVVCDVPNCATDPETFRIVGSWTAAGVLVGAAVDVLMSHLGRREAMRTFRLDSRHSSR